MTTTITNPGHTLTTAISARSRMRRNKLKGTTARGALATMAKRNDILPDLKIEKRQLSSLKYPERRMRTVTNEHVTEIAHSIARLGLVKPILITADGRVIEGISVAEAAGSLGLSEIPCIVIDHLMPDEIRLLRLALNRLGEKGAWKLPELKLEFQELHDAGFTLADTGFTMPEVDLVLMTDEPTIDKNANDCPAPEFDSEPVSRLGDEWQLGRHHIVCGDATKPEPYARLFRDLPLARAAFTDPPYNVKIDGFAAAKGKHCEFVTASGEMSDDEFVTFLTEFLSAASEHVIDGGIIFCCMDWRHVEHVCRAARAAGLSMVNLVVWSKGVGGMGGLYRSAYELVFVLKKGNGPILNNVQLGKFGCDKTNVVVYPGANQRGSSANAELENHPTPKPVELVADALRDVTERDDIVIDPFLGSGTTIIAAQRTGRTAVGLELDPHYVDLIIRRFEKYSGIQAVHTSGKTFVEISAERRTETDVLIPEADTSPTTINGVATVLLEGTCASPVGSVATPAGAAAPTTA